MVQAVDKAIRDANLGLSPTVEGTILRIRIPELNEQRRKEMVKVAHKYSEDARVAVRHVRRDGIDVLKKLLKDHAISEDDEKHHETEVQKATDQAIREIDVSLAAQRKGDHAGLGDRRHCPRPCMHYPRPNPAPSPAPDAGPCRHHHGRQRPLGAGARPAALRGPPARRRSGAPARFARRSNSACAILTIYSFSSENWSRPPEEVAMLMGLLKRFIRNDLAELNANGVESGSSASATISRPISSR